ncbi:hypothetical protein [Mahella australiensis]|uniref:Uncharacterized protein n=1 Tax=Mahella australiensis (strain DSM 15567 / CIP 107919 / 50-1 BON) TaxID=697281 RepID=F3ZYQ0_MAHA5|nr:hypothetical protein [Mahella australiensis]AEE97818.1 hypothetical protein Mahau_2682 [Mahella australiensis 50-1 BON]
MLHGAEQTIKKTSLPPELINDITVDLSLKYNVVVSIFLQSFDQYRQFVDALPFFMNVEKEGIEL